MFITIDDPAKFEYDGKSFAVFLGCNAPDGIPRSSCIATKHVAPKVLDVVKSIDISKFKNGLFLVVDQATYEKESSTIDEIQKYLAWAYCKFIEFPLQSNTIPDIYNVRKKNNPAEEDSFSELIVLREIQKAQNTHLYTQNPLCDVLKKVRNAPPILLLMPGPSLKELNASKLRRLRKRLIVVCFSRTLSTCIALGVAPDFVINLDTNFSMAQMLDPGMKLPHTWLISLSSANIANVSSNFRGIFFMESFNQSILNNAHRLKESWLSCSISGLGLAEALNVKEVYIAGGDHSWYGDKKVTSPYMDSYSKLVAPNQKAAKKIPLVSQGLKTGDSTAVFDAFTLPDRNGYEATTYFNYFAAAVELEYIAREMPDTNFYSITDKGILPVNIFKDAASDDILAKLPYYNRTKLQKQLDRVHAIKPELDLSVFLKNLLQLHGQVQLQSSYLDFLLASGNENEVSQHPLVQSLKRSISQRKFPPFVTPGTELPALLRICTLWKDSLAQGIAFLRYVDFIARISKQEVESNLHSSFKPTEIQLFVSKKEHESKNLLTWTERLKISGFSLKIKITPYEPANPADQRNWNTWPEINIFNWNILEPIKRDMGVDTPLTLITREAIEEYPCIFQLLDPTRTIIFEDLVKKLLLPEYI